MKLPIIQWRPSVVWRKDYAEVEAALLASTKAHGAASLEIIRLRKELDVARRGCETLRKEKAAAEREHEKELHRADHFQRRCEGYEDAAAREGKKFCKAADEETFYALIPSTKYKRA